jgi:hypothetical protein
MYYMSPVNILNTGQFQHENKTWRRLLDFFKQENTFLKNRLAEVLDQNMDKDFLALAEHFQNKFIIKDEYIDELRHDINIQQNNLPLADEILADRKLIKHQQKLRNEMEYFEKDFSRLKNEFNKYLSTGG